MIKLAFSNAIVGSNATNKGAKGKSKPLESHKTAKRRSAQEVLAPCFTVNFPVLAYVSEDPMRNQITFANLQNNEYQS